MAAPSLTPQLLERLEPIRSLSAAVRQELLERLRPDFFPPGTDPIAEAQGKGGTLYLLRGELLLRLAGGGSKVVVGACDEARWPLGNLGATSSRTITPVEVLRLDPDRLDLLLAWDQVAAAVMAAPRSTDDSTLWWTVAGALHSHALNATALALLPPAHLPELLMRFARIKLKKGDVVIREGEEGDGYYLIEAGKCHVSRTVGGAQVAVADLQTGEGFGEEALISGRPRNATVTMKTDGVLLKLAKPDFDELIGAPLSNGATWAEAQAMVAAGEAQWLDVRYAAEFVVDGLPGASNVPLNEIRSAFQVLDPAKQYVVYCQSGRRSSAAAFLLAQKGFKAVWLKGGLAARETGI